jgi:hypothetical protein
MRIPASVSKKERYSRHNLRSAASIILMSVSPEPPEGLAEILLEILALSKPIRTSQSESARERVIQSNHATRIALKSSRNGETKKTTTGRDHRCCGELRRFAAKNS